MNKEQKALLELAKCAMDSTLLNLEYFENVDWNELYLLTIDAKLDAIVYDVVSALEPDYAPPQELMQVWKHRVLSGIFSPEKKHNMQQNK